MQIRIESIETPGGPIFDLVMKQGPNTIRLGLTCLSPRLAQAQLAAFIAENTLDTVELCKSGASTKKRGAA